MVCFCELEVIESVNAVVALRWNSVVDKVRSVVVLVTASEFITELGWTVVGIAVSATLVVMSPLVAESVVVAELCPTEVEVAAVESATVEVMIASIVVVLCLEEVVTGLVVASDFVVDDVLGCATFVVVASEGVLGWNVLVVVADSVAVVVTASVVNVVP